MFYIPQPKENKYLDCFSSNLKLLPVSDITTYISFQLSTDKTVKVLNILEKNIQDGSKLSTLLNHVSLRPVLLTLPLVLLNAWFSLCWFDKSLWPKAPRREVACFILHFRNLRQEPWSCAAYQPAHGLMNSQLSYTAEDHLPRDDMPTVGWVPH